MNTQTLVLNTNALPSPHQDKLPRENRATAYAIYDNGIPTCTVAVTAFNRLEKTRYCIECIIKYTEDIPYELLLIDNGSDDGTLEYFESVEHPNKKVVRITKNIGAGYSWLAAKNVFSGKYLVIVANDVYVTKNWLRNLLICYESDPRIGFVAPVSSNVSNLQQVDLNFADFDDMQRQAAAYNNSDPLKWEERLRCISLIGVYSRPVLDLVGLNDAAFLHDFIEDDYAERLRRNGFKLMLCRDTWVCHDHSISSMTQEELSAMYVKAVYGRAVFFEKYNLDAWDDTLNFEQQLLAAFDSHPFGDERLEVLVIDPRCGSPVLEIRNRLRRRGLLAPVISAFTTQAKYYTDLLAVADSVKCDRLEYILESYAAESFDVVVLCEQADAYSSPDETLKNLSTLTKNRGLLLYKANNAEYDAVLPYRLLKGGD